jgi:hypothetical protein
MEKMETMTESSPTQLYAAEFSPSNRQFHLDTLRMALYDATHHMESGAVYTGYDWRIFFMGTYEGAESAIAAMKEAVNPKEAHT